MLLSCLDRMKVPQCVQLVFTSFLPSYHTSHFLIGFIRVPSGQLKSFEKSRMLLIGPRTRNSAGEWTPVVMRILRVSENLRREDAININLTGIQE